MDRQVLIYQMTERFQELYGQALDAVEQAPDGQWISASEQAFRDTFLQLMKESYQAALQARIDAHPTACQAAFSPCKPGDSGRAEPAEQGPAPGPGPHHRRRS